MGLLHREAGEEIIERDIYTRNGLDGCSYPDMHVGLGASYSHACLRPGRTRGFGREVYKTRCASCHGTDMEGGDHGAPLKDDHFWGEWEGKTARSLYSRILSTMPLDDPGTLPENDVLKIVGHIVVVGGGTDRRAHV